jgi:predicted metal-dependent hydrolase
VTITTRRVEFEFDPNAVPTAWYRGDPHLTTLWSALSLLFPEGERFFVEAVRRYRDRLADPALREAVDGFIGQEAMHGKQHRAYNELVRARLAVAGPAEAQVRRLLARARRRLSGRRQLAVTCALEHFTSIMAEQLLRDEAHRESIHESVRPLWVWHALEESEHKAVAFDVFRAVGGTYAMRCSVMLVTTAAFFAELLHVHARLLREAGMLADVRGWARAIGYLWLRPGIFRRLVPAYLDYFRPGFHPDDRDSRAIVEAWRASLFGPAGELRTRLHAA